MRRRRTGGPGLGWSAVALFVIAVLLCVGGLMDTGLPTQQSDVQALNKEPSEYGVETEDTSHQKSTLPGEELRDLTGDSSDGDATYGVSDGLRTYEEEGTVEQVAYHLLTSYRDAGDCTLADAGYLDLLGSVWGCVVCGDGWSEVCVVWGRGERTSCTVRVLHVDRAELGQVFGEGEGGP